MKANRMIILVFLALAIERDSSVEAATTAKIKSSTTIAEAETTAPPSKRTRSTTIATTTNAETTAPLSKRTRSTTAASSTDGETTIQSTKRFRKSTTTDPETTAIDHTASKKYKTTTKSTDKFLPTDVADENAEVVTPSSVIDYCPALNPYRALPPVSAKDLLGIDAGFVIDRIVEVADVEQTVSVRGILTLSWQVNKCDADATSIGLERHSSKLAMVTQDMSDLWVPSVLFQSSVSDVAMSEITKYLRVSVKESDGTKRPVIFIQRGFGVYQTEGHFELTSFPFDSQNISFKFCLTSASKNMAFVPNGTLFSMKPPSSTEQWWIDPSEQSIYIMETLMTSGPMDEAYPASCIIYSQIIHRRPDFFILNIMAPNALLVALNIVAFLVPPDIVDRTSMNVGILMAVSVFVTLVVQYIPQNPERVFLSVFTFLMAAFCALCTLQSALVFWFSQAFPKKAEQRVCCFSFVRLLDIVTFLALTCIPIWTSMYALSIASSSKQPAY